MTTKTRTYTINPDSWSVAGCSYIYAPRGQAGEYAKLAANPYRGCGHACAYCYVPKVLKIDRPTFDANASPRPGFMESLRKDAAKYQACGITEQVMLSFTTDPFNPFDVSLTRPTIETIKVHGLAFCTLTKGGRRALPFLDLFRPERDAFASTLTSLDDAFSLKWERGAALPADRMATLQAFHAAGIFTWVSLEPTLDTASSIAIIEATHNYVDLYKVGRANYLPMTYTTDWQDYTLRILDVVNRLSVKHYIKHDLQPYLPAGYHNPKYIDQHHGAGAPAALDLFSIAA
jgi:DNA repair photolyase